MRTTPGSTGRGGGLAYDRRGSGPVVVMLHGLGSSRRCWDLLVPLISDRATVYTVDLPGHGESDWDHSVTSIHPRELAVAVADWLDSIGVDTAHVVGNSMGGWVGLELAALGRAGSVTALCPAGFWADDFHPSTSLPETRDLALWLRPVLPALMSSRLARRVAFRNAVERPGNVPFHIALDAATAQIMARGFDACLNGMTGTNAKCAVDVPATVPMTVVFGDRDRVLPAPAFQRRDLAPGHADWQVWWRCGHAPMWDVPDACAALVHRQLDAAVADRHDGWAGRT
jgi:pimeloyl-ACP methyl ester carboxylesterase